MAQSGYTPILIYASGTASNVPLAANMTSSASGAELALNYADGKLYFKNSSGVVTLLAGSGGGGPAAGSNTQVQFNNSGVFGASANLTWNGTALSTTGLTFTGTGNRITGDMTNATQANRVAFQTSTANSATTITVIPSGTGTQSSINLFNNSDPTNASLLNMLTNAADARINSTITGTGTYLPMTFYTGGSEAVRIGSGASSATDKGTVGIGYTSLTGVGNNGLAVLGNVGIGTTSPSTKLSVSSSGPNGVDLAVDQANSVASARLFFSNGTAGQACSISNDTGALKFNRAATAGSSTGAESMRIDTNGLIGVKGAASTSWSSTYQVIQYNAGPALWSANNTNINFSSNIYNDGTSRYITSAGAGYVNASTGGITLNSLQSGTAGNAVTVGAIFNVNTTDCVMTTANGGLGYGTGSGGTVTQGAGSGKATAVTLNKPTGVITMNNAALAAGASVVFALSNTLLAAVDTVIVGHNANGGTANAYTVQALTVGATSVSIRVTNITAGSLSEAVQINFAIIKGASA
jgi:hypothetical protein